MKGDDLICFVDGFGNKDFNLLLGLLEKLIRCTFEANNEAGRIFYNCMNFLM